MCDANAYLRKGEEEELILSEVTSVEAVEGGWRVSSLFGDEVIVKGRLEGVNLVKRKILFDSEG